jgi:hypothetical protein
LLTCAPIANRRPPHGLATRLQDVILPHSPILRLAYHRSMHVKPALLLLPACIGFAVSLPAQFDTDKFTAGLRANFGPPLAREVFLVPAGEMVVDYAVNGHACRIQLPAVGPEEGTNVRSPKAVDDFLLKLLPLSMRGKGLGKMAEGMSLQSVLITHYENVTISEFLTGQRRTGMTVTFTKEKCQDRPTQ